MSIIYYYLILFYTPSSTFNKCHVLEKWLFKMFWAERCIISLWIRWNKKLSVNLHNSFLTHYSIRQCNNYYYTLQYYNHHYSSPLHNKFLCNKYLNYLLIHSLQNSFDNSFDFELWIHRNHITINYKIPSICSSPPTHEPWGYG